MFDADIIQNLMTTATDFTADLLRHLPLTETSSEMVDGYHYGLEHGETENMNAVIDGALQQCQG
ncbi:hypothetical protein [Corynebacterium mastitidis]|uniref:hypothetical protein n=1 Tax=Corynebacterium mastitidis TaxID=161890 RepID=UPI002550741E|nr:hypothetical protein [Corynebacterium mastitidis]MDK8450216.1 hypothetical protein [Corynebacterium mastitidis]